MDKYHLMTDGSLVKQTKDATTLPPNQPIGEAVKPAESTSTTSSEGSVKMNHSSQQSVVDKTNKITSKLRKQSARRKAILTSWVKL